MIIINKTKKIKKFDSIEMPNFQSRYLQHAWLKSQDKKYQLLNIKSVSIQYKDILRMIYSDNYSLVALYTYYSRLHLNAEDYITINKKGNEHVIYELINSDWLLNKEELEKKSLLKLEQEIIYIEKMVKKLELIIKDYNSNHQNKTFYIIDIKNRIMLLNYKKECINEYINKLKQEENINKSLIKVL